MAPFRKIWAFLGLLLSVSHVATADYLPNPRFRTFIESGTFADDYHQQKLVTSFYEQNGFTLAWYGRTADSGKRNSLVTLIANAGLFALEPAPYHYSILSSREELTSELDTFSREALLTDAAMSFMHDLAYGGDLNFVKYNGLRYHPDKTYLIAALNKGLQGDNLRSALIMVEPNSNKYNCLKEKYLPMYVLWKSEGFEDVEVTSNEVATQNRGLVGKLTQLGYLKENDTSLNSLKDGLKKFQQEHNILVQNTISTSCMQLLNEKINDRLKALAWNIKWYRWLNEMEGKTYIIINIPANRLTYFSDGQVKLESKMVVGKISTPTPTLTSVIKNVIYYPYWNVPTSIAVNEMLPKLKRSSSYLNYARLQVLQNGKVINGGAINWHNYSAGNFPFQLRERTGCANALGRLKFDFENPFNVYLHDTDFKGAFLSSRRYLSHGCMRIEKPYELAVALGVPPAKVDMSKCLENKKPEIIPLPQQVPIFVVYATIDVENGRLAWYDDAYHRMGKLF